MRRPSRRPCPCREALRSIDREPAETQLPALARDLSQARNPRLSSSPPGPFGLGSCPRPTAPREEGRSARAPFAPRMAPFGCPRKLPGRTAGPPTPGSLSWPFLDEAFDGGGDETTIGGKRNDDSTILRLRKHLPFGFMHLG